MTVCDRLGKTVQPLVSVCVPTYNDASFLLQSLKSITHQTYQNLEILVGDDGSTDNTAEIVQSLIDARIHYYQNSINLGQFENVNCLVQKARGKYVAIYHSDDIYAPHIVEKEVDFLESHPGAGAVFALNWRINDIGQITGESKLLPNVPAATGLSLADVLPVLLRYKNRLLIGPTFMGRAEVFQKVGFFSSAFDIAGDFEMWLRILTAFQIGILDEPLMYYRRGKTQVSYGYQYLRTFEDHFFTIVDRYIDTDSVSNQLDPTAFTEYTFHRCDDQTFRAVNFVIQGQIDQAKDLLQSSYPWRTLTVPHLLRRKLRVLLLRNLMKSALALNAVRPLTQFLIWLEYGGKL